MDHWGLHRQGLLLLVLSVLYVPSVEATIINGQVTDGMGQGIASVNLDYIDLATGTNIPLANGGTDILGFYSIDVPEGNYDVRYKPARGDRHAAKIVRNVSVAGASMVIDETLDDAWFVTARVLDPLGMPLVDADMDVVDSLSGEKLFIANDKTDGNGDFQVAVSSGLLDIVIEPPPGTRLLTRVFSMQLLDADLPLGDVTLTEGWLVSGRVTDSGAVPVLAADIDALVPASGEKFPISHDKTDGGGQFAIVVEAGAWDIDVAPPPGSRLLSQRLLGIALPPDADLGTIVLESGWLLSGRVVDSLGMPVPGVDIDAVDPVSGTSFPLTGDTTDSDGFFSVGVPAGTWRVDFEPPPGSRLVARQIHDVGLVADLDLGDVALESGFLLSGRVVDGGGLPVSGADLDVTDEATGVKLPLSNDMTDILGMFELAVPAGVWRVDVQPSEGTRLQARSLPDTTVTADTPLGDIVLSSGWFLTGRVVDGAIAPVANVNLDLVDEASGLEVPLANDRSGADGSFSLVVGDGVFTLQLKPSLTGPHAPKEIPGVGVSADLDLGDIVLAPGFPVDGRVIDEVGVPVADADIDLVEAATGMPVFLTGDKTALDGTFVVKAVSGVHDVVVTPPAGRALLSSTVSDVVTDAPVSLGDIVLPGGVALSGIVEAPAGSALADVRVTVVDAASLIPLGPSALSDASGAYSLGVPPSNNVTLSFEPPVAGPWLPRLLAGINLNRERSLPVVVLDRGVILSGLVTDEGGSPVSSALVSVLARDNGGVLAESLTGDDGSFALIVMAGTHDIVVDAPLGSGLASARLLAELADVDRVLPTFVLSSAFSVSARLVDGAAMPVEGVGVRAWPSVGGDEIPIPAILSAADGRFSFPLSPNTVDLRFTPTALSGLGAATQTDLIVTADVDLGDLVLPNASAPLAVLVTPGNGSTRGGELVTVQGNGFAPGVTVLLGGVALDDLTLVDSLTLRGVTRARPAGLVDIEVRNPGLIAERFEGIFEYVQAVPDILLRVDEAGPIATDVLLTWTDDGRSQWRVFRSTSPTDFSDADVLGAPSESVFADRQAAGLPGVHYFLVE